MHPRRLRTTQTSPQVPRVEHALQDQQKGVGQRLKARLQSAFITQGQGGFEKLRNHPLMAFRYEAVESAALRPLNLNLLALRPTQHRAEPLSAPARGDAQAAHVARAQRRFHSMDAANPDPLAHRRRFRGPPREPRPCVPCRSAVRRRPLRAGRGPRLTWAS